MKIRLLCMILSATNCISAMDNNNSIQKKDEDPNETKIKGLLATMAEVKKGIDAAKSSNPNINNLSPIAQKAFLHYQQNLQKNNDNAPGYITLPPLQPDNLRNSKDSEKDSSALTLKNLAQIVSEQKTNNDGDPMDNENDNNKK